VGDYEPVREVRFGLVLYGGVSLAVYINGVVQELFALVRATAPQLGSEDELHHKQLRGTEPVYRDVGRLYGEDAPTDVDDAADVVSPDDAPAPAGPVRTRFVVDIISGSSAGGINGIYLAKALANQQDIEGLRTLWVDAAGVADLLNDSTTRKKKEWKARLPKTEAAEALFSGDLMYLRLLDALDAMDGGAHDRPPDHADPSPYVSDLDLWITATDLEGATVPLQLADEPILEKRHRHVFHFVFGEAQREKGTRNDFAGTMNPILAFAARATSSFPVAFVPARLADIARVRRVVGGRSEKLDPLDGRWQRWFPNQRLVPGYDYENVSFGDGGDMDNKPFGWAIDTLPARTSSTPVDRRLLYVEPDPGDPTVLPGEAAPPPDVIDSGIAAFSLGRVEVIRDDIERVAKVSAVRERVGAARRAVEDQYLAGHVEPVGTDAWLAQVGDELAALGLGYAAYFRLRVDALISEYARSLVGLPWHAAGTPRSAAMEALVRIWVRERFADPYHPVPQQQTEKDFLLRFDMAFRIRRLAFASAQADRLYRNPPADLEGTVEDFRRETRGLRKVMGDAEQALRLWVPSIRSNPDELPNEFPLSDEDVEAFQRQPGWAATTWTARKAELEHVADEVDTFLAALFEQAKTPVCAALEHGDPSDGAREARERIRLYYDYFTEFDQALFPLQVASGVTGEVDAVQVHRISPQDAKTLIDPTKAPKVAGSRLGHFGGFLDRTWRANDIMWGRLDTAERLLKCLIPESPNRPALLEQAHDTILREEWYQPGRGGEARLGDPLASDAGPAGIAWRKARFQEDYQPPPWPAGKELLTTVSRTTAVTSKMLEGVAARPGAKFAHRIVASISWVLTALTTVLYPFGAFKTPVRLLGALVAALGAALFAMGSLLNWDPATATGAPLLVIGSTLIVMAFVVRLFRHDVKKGAIALLGLLVVGLVLYGGWSVSRDLRDWGTDDPAPTTTSEP
jgi:patatin-related protein